MLVIRMQRLGRKGHAQFRVVVQDSRRTPTSGKVVANLGSYNPHTKQTTLNKEKAQFYLDHGAQPTSRVAQLLKREGVKLPAWVKIDQSKERSVRNPEKRRSTAPEQPQEEAPAETAEEGVESADAPAEEPAAEEAPAEEAPAEPKAAEESSEEAKE